MHVVPCLEEDDDDDDHDEYYVFSPKLPVANKGMPSTVVNDKINNDSDDDDYSHEYLKLISISNNNSTNQK